MAEVPAFQHYLEMLVGKRCWGVVAGRNTGTSILVDLGAMRPRRRALTNPNLSPEQRINEAECVLFVQCSWRIDSPEGVVCTSQDFTDEGDAPVGLYRLVGLEVREAHVTPPFGDIRVRFENSTVLQVYNDAAEGDDAYSIFAPDQILVIRSNGELAEEPRVRATD